MPLAEEFAEAVENLTVPHLLLRNATEHGDRPALTSGSEAPVTLTWAEVRELSADFSEGLVALGLEPGDRMLIMMSSRPEHWIADYGAMHARAIPCTAYATLSTDQIHYVAAHSAASIAVLEGAEEVDRWRPILDQLPDLRHIVIVDEAAVPGGEQGGGKIFLPYSAVLAIGRERHHATPGVFEQRWRQIKPEDPVGMMYTSGTTGDPKGVVLSHRNVLYQTVAIDRLTAIPDFTDTIAYLPLAHIAERALSLYGAVLKTAHIHLCPDPTQVVGVLGRVRPVGFFGVPRIWEKIASAVQGAMKAAEPEKRAAFEQAHALALEVFDLTIDGKQIPDELAERLTEADRDVLAPIRSLLGLDKILRASSGAAPIAVETLRYLAGLGVVVREVWGMTETSGAATITTEDDFRLGAVGKAVPGIDLKIAEDGEIFVRGPILLLGYLQPDGTIESPLDEDGWLATGDVGALDEEGFLTITDRKKELLITAAGKNVAPTMIEGLLTAHPLIGFATAIGDRRPYITALIVLDPDALPASARQSPDVRAAVEAAVQAANAKLSRAEQIKRYAILTEPWTPESGELTPTLKLRRRIIHDRYADVIRTLYEVPQ